MKRPPHTAGKETKKVRTEDGMILFKLQRKSDRSICKKFRGKCKRRFPGSDDDYSNLADDLFASSTYENAFEGTGATSADGGEDANVDIKAKLQEAFSDIITASVSLYSNLTKSTQKYRLSNEFTVQLYKLIDTMINIISKFGK